MHLFINLNFLNINMIVTQDLVIGVFKIGRWYSVDEIVKLVFPMCTNYRHDSIERNNISSKLRLLSKQNRIEKINRGSRLLRYRLLSS